MQSNNLPPNLPALKPGWAWVKLGDVCEPPQYGYTTSATTIGDLKFLRTTDITSGAIDWESVPYCKENPKQIDKYILNDNDVVISRAGSIGVSYLLSKPPKAVFASYLIRFKPKINTKFFFYFLKSPSYWNHISEKKLGIAVPNVNATKLKEIPFPLPPLPEQKKIVAKIEELFSELDSGVANLRKAKEQIKTYRQSVLAHAFTGRLHQDSQDLQIDRIKESSKSSNPQNPGSDNLTDGWKWVKLGEIFEVVTGTTPSKKQKEFYGEDYPLYKPTDLNAGINVLGASDKLSKRGIKRARLLPEGSVLVTCIGATIGKTGLIKIAGASNQQINALVKNESFNPKFVYHFCTSDVFQKQIIENASSTTLPIINKSRFEKLLFLLIPLDQQHQIVSEIEKRFSVADNLGKAIDESLNRSDKLRQSILKKAFEGRLV